MIQSQNLSVRGDRGVERNAKFNVSSFDGTVPWKTYIRQFQAAAVHNAWTDSEKAVALTVNLKGAAQQILATFKKWMVWSE